LELRWARWTVVVNRSYCMEDIVISFCLLPATVLLLPLLMHLTWLLLVCVLPSCPATAVDAPCRAVPRRVMAVVVRLLSRLVSTLECCR
jgi:hypothetical protein